MHIQESIRLVLTLCAAARRGSSCLICLPGLCQLPELREGVGDLQAHGLTCRQQGRGRGILCGSCRLKMSGTIPI